VGVGTQSRFLHRTIVIRIFMTQKDFKLISHALKILEMPILSRNNSFWHKKIDQKVVWSRFHPVGTQSRFLHRTIVIRIFMTRKDFKLIKWTEIVSWGDNVLYLYFIFIFFNVLFCNLYEEMLFLGWMRQMQECGSCEWFVRAYY
jgi:hypothetical protein